MREPLQIMVGGGWWRLTTARVAAGGVGSRPWQLTAVEQALVGRPAMAGTYEAAPARATDGARPLTHNAFMPALLRRTLVRALTGLGAFR